MIEFKINLPPPDPNEEEIQVGPVEAESPAEVLARLEQRDRELRRLADEEEFEEVELVTDKPTFTLKQMFIVITVLGVWLGVLRMLSSVKPILAGITGVAALVCMFWISAQEDQPKILRYVWWGMLLVYLTTSIATWVGG